MLIILAIVIIVLLVLEETGKEMEDEYLVEKRKKLKKRGLRFRS